MDASQGTPKVWDIDHKRLIVELTKTPAAKPADPFQLKFGRTYTDHMLEIEWSAENGWDAPRIVPRHPLMLDPGASVLHYALEAFEGMKAFLDPQGNLRLFRPMMNMHRFIRSAGRVTLPSFNPEELLECIKELLRIEKDWCPKPRGTALYIRPTIISTYPVVGVTVPQTALIYVILCPVGPYYPTGWQPVKLLCSDGYCRAFPGGTGSYKVGGNYAMSMVPSEEAAKKGYQQVLWLHEDNCTEVGTMNFFTLWKTKDGKKELVTCPVGDVCLAGITRDSVLHLAREKSDLIVSERNYTIHELIEAQQEGRLLECFGTGTAAVISPVSCIGFKGKDYDVPLNAKDPKQPIGPFAKEIYDQLTAIQYGDVEHSWAMTV